MSHGLNKEQRYDFMVAVLKKHAHAYPLMTDDQLRDYAELIHIFLNTDNDTSQKGAVATMIGHVENATYMNRAKEKAIEAGEHHKAIKVAKKMIEKGYTYEEIHELTELALEEINQITL
ncbi:hypothetical protein CVD28_02780 [Bacillus sp. M6-12]|uniref:hypothetical protein n=1 Tax=Bacillus sp. M6-12 TaxID=2054166 RepID=UPI000C770378|nr:hypothetical protein [Bacillus sp. M6-12]PLS19357.1 hypothetical protein CVD28_02780 [Bacillus sp. M6-12]